MLIFLIGIGIIGIAETTETPGFHVVVATKDGLQVSRSPFAPPHFCKFDPRTRSKPPTALFAPTKPAVRSGQTLRLLRLKSAPAPSAVKSRGINLFLNIVAFFLSIIAENVIIVCVNGVLSVSLQANYEKNGRLWLEKRIRTTSGGL